MAAAPVTGTLSVAGDVLGIVLGNTGFGQFFDVQLALSLSGTFVGATVAVEALAVGQPLIGVAGTAPVSTSEWVAVSSAAAGGNVNSPLGPLSSAGGPGTGFTYATPCYQFQQLRLRLVSIASGSVVASIASVPVTFNVVSNPNEALELGRVRIGMSILLEGMGINLSDLTAADIANLS